MDETEKDKEGKEQQPQDSRRDTVAPAAETPEAAAVAPETKEETSETGGNDEAKAEKGATKGKKGKRKFTGSVLGNKTIEDVIRREAKEEQDFSSPFSLPKTLGGVMIARAFRNQIGLVCLICAFLIIYINNRYVCQKRMVEIDKIERRMVEARYKATVCTSILTEKSRESNIMNLLGAYGDSTLTIPNEPPYLIRVDE